MEWLGLKRRPTVYAHMHVGALYTRIYVIYVHMPTDILLLCVNRRMYKLYIRFYNVQYFVYFTSVIVAASWWHHSGWAGIRYNATLSLAATFCFWMISSSAWLSAIIGASLLSTRVFFELRFCDLRLYNSEVVYTQLVCAHLSVLSNTLKHLSVCVHVMPGNTCLHVCYAIPGKLGVGITPPSRKVDRDVVVFVLLINCAPTAAHSNRFFSNHKSLIPGVYITTAC